jgi:Spy/CpxP family protein refolding chaperone
MKYFLRSFWAVMLLATVSLSASAQTPAARQGRLNQLENAKIAYITDKVSLTQDQAQKFWPVYNDFTNKRKDLNRQMRQLRTGNLDALSDQQIKEGLDQAMALREQEVKLEKEYFGRFQKILSIRQVGKLYGAERDFTREVIKRVADRRGGAGRGPAHSGQAED